MLTVAEITSLVTDICTLSNGLPSSVPNGSKEDKIWAVMNSDDGETPHETFNKRFDAMFGEDCRDLHGRLHHVRRGKLGIGLVCSYLTNLDWTDIPLDLAEIKLRRLLVELKQLQCVSNPFLSPYTNELFRASDTLRSRPARKTNPTSKLRDTNNVEKADLSFQRKAVEEFRSHQAAIEVQATQSHADKILPARPPHAQALSLSSSATENESRSNITAAIQNVETGSEDDMDNADEQPIQRTSYEFLSLSKDLTTIVAKKKLVRSNTASSSHTKRAASVVINEDTEDEDTRRSF